MCIRDSIDRSGTQAVGGKRPNEFGLYDMLGNVSEWCEDVTAPYPNPSPKDYAGPHLDSPAAERVARGGAWRDAAVTTHAAFRGRWPPGLYLDDVGFRVVRPAARP